VVVTTAWVVAGMTLEVVGEMADALKTDVEENTGEVSWVDVEVFSMREVVEVSPLVEVVSRIVVVGTFISLIACSASGLTSTKAITAEAPAMKITIASLYTQNLLMSLMLSSLAFVGPLVPLPEKWRRG
jgi:hypothetical protein